MAPGAAVSSVAADSGFEVSLGQAGEPVLEGDRLALLGDAQPARDRTWRLGEDRRVRRPTSASRAPAAAVEHGQAHAALRGDGYESLLRLVDGPLRGERATVLARVGVAHHHLDLGARPCVEQLRDETVGAFEVGDRLEQGHAVELGTRAARRAAPRR